MNGSTVRNQGWVRRNLNGANPSSDGDPAADDAPTEVIADRPAPASNKGRGVVPAVTAVLMLALLIMAAGMVVAQLVGGGDRQPGPGGATVAWHVAGAVAGVVCYRYSRRRGAVRLLALLAIVVITALVLWFFWWSPG